MERLPWKISHLGITCIDCDHWFRDFRDFKTHMKANHGGITRPQLCPYCPGMCFSLAGMSEHVTLHKQADHIPRRQTERGRFSVSNSAFKKFSVKPERKQPDRVRQTSEKPSASKRPSWKPQVGNPPSRSAVNPAEKLVTNNPTEPEKRKLPSETSGLSSGGTGYAKRQRQGASGRPTVSQQSSGITVRKCPLCNKLVWKLGLHLRSGIHAGERGHKCGTCGEGFFTEAALKRHQFIKTHRQDLTRSQAKATSAEAPGKSCVTTQTTASSSAVREEAQQVSNQSKLTVTINVPGKPDNKKKAGKTHAPPTKADVSGKSEASNEIASNAERIWKKGHRTKKTKCPYCPKLFRDKFNLRQHLRTSNHAEHQIVRESYKCVVCGKRFVSLTSLRKHASLLRHNLDPSLARMSTIKTTSDGTKWQRKSTSSNNDSLPTVGADRRHKSSGASSGSSKCHDAENMAALERRCPLCRRWFSRHYDVSRHMQGRKHAGQRDYKCDICTAVFRTVLSLIRHRDTKHLIHEQLTANPAGKAQDSTQKTVIGMSSGSGDGGQVHDQASKATSSNAKRFKCPKCDMRFQYLYLVRVHLVTKQHSKGSSSPTCPTCGKNFPDRTKLQAHELLHATPSSTCDVKKQQDSQSQRDRPSRNVGHVGQLDPEKRPHVSPATTRTTIPTDWNSKAGIHKKAGVRPHESISGSTSGADCSLRKIACPLCKKSVDKNSMKRHLHSGVHAGKKAFLCSKCPDAFWTPAALRQHLKLKHDDVAEPLNPPWAQDHAIRPSSAHTTPEQGIYMVGANNVENAVKSSAMSNVQNQSGTNFGDCQKMVGPQGSGANTRQAFLVSSHSGVRHPAGKITRRFKCPKCDERFVRFAHVLRHLATRKHNNRGIYLKCSRCDATFQSASELRKHEYSRETTCGMESGLDQNREHSPSPMRDRKSPDDVKKLPGGKLTAGSSDEVTQRIESGERASQGFDFNGASAVKPAFQRKRARKCFLCGRWVSGSNMCHHFRRHHRGEKCYGCITCGESFFTSTALKKHGRGMNHLVKPFMCNMCGEIMLTPREHVALHKEEIGQRALHKEAKEQGKSPRHRSMKTCRNTCQAEAYLKKQPERDQTANASVKGGQSMESGEPASTGEAVNRPMFRKNGDRNCLLCSKWISSRNMGCHLRTHHPGQKGFACYTCGKRFLASSALKRHGILKNHLALSYVCSVCGEVMGSPNEHTALHKEAKDLEENKPRLQNFGCPQCDVKFRHADDVLKHMSYVHSMDMLLGCSTCGEGFATLQDLSEHKLSHGSVAHGASVLEHEPNKPEVKFLCPGKEEPKMSVGEHFPSSSKARFETLVRGDGQDTSNPHMIKDNENKMSHDVQGSYRDNYVKGNVDDEMMGKGGYRFLKIESSHSMAASYCGADSDKTSGKYAARRIVKLEQDTDQEPEAFEEPTRHTFELVQSRVHPGKSTDWNTAPMDTSPEHQSTPLHGDLHGRSDKSSEVIGLRIISFDGPQKGMCDVCLDDCDSEENLVTHRRRHFWHGLPQCHKCEATFVSIQHLRRHLKNHTDNAD